MGSFPPVPQAPKGFDPDFSKKRKQRMQKKGIAPPQVPMAPRKNGKPIQVPFMMPPHSKAT